MVVVGLTALAEGLSGEQRLQVVAVLLGVMVFAVVILVVERRNHGHEAAPPGMTAAEAPRPAPHPAPRQVYRPPAQSVPTASARAAADEPAGADPYPVPFVNAAEPEAPAGGEGPGNS